MTPSITFQTVGFSAASQSRNGALKLAISSCALGPVNWPWNDEGVGPTMSKAPEKVVLPGEKTASVKVYRGRVGASIGPFNFGSMNPVSLPAAKSNWRAAVP